MLMREVGSSRDVRARPALVLMRRRVVAPGCGGRRLVAGGDGRVPAHAADDHDIQTAQQRGRAGGSGLLAGQPVLVAGGEVVEPRGQHRVVHGPRPGS
jgi:hypothetical protein